MSTKTNRFRPRIIPILIHSVKYEILFYFCKKRIVRCSEKYSSTLSTVQLTPSIVNTVFRSSLARRRIFNDLIEVKQGRV